MTQITNTKHTKIKFIRNIYIINNKLPWTNVVYYFSISKQNNLYSFDEGVLPSAFLPHIYNNNY